MALSVAKRAGRTAASSFGRTESRCASEFGSSVNRRDDSSPGRFIQDCGAGPVLAAGNLLHIGIPGQVPSPYFRRHRIGSPTAQPMFLVISIVDGGLVGHLSRTVVSDPIAAVAVSIVVGAYGERRIGAGAVRAVCKRLVRKREPYGESKGCGYILSCLHDGSPESEKRDPVHLCRP